MIIKNRIRLSYFLSLFLICQFMHQKDIAAASNTGNTSGIALEMSGSAKSLIMGDTTIASSYGSEAVWLNPAGLYVFPGKFELGMSRTKLVETIRLNFLSAAFSFSSKNTLGFGLADLEQDPIEGINNQGQNTGNIETGDRYVIIGYSRHLTSKTATGVSIKYLESRIGNNKAEGTALDIGLQKQILKNLNFGLVLKNAGTRIRYRQKKEPLPLKLGAGFNLGLQRNLGMTFGVEKNLISRLFKFNLGTEYTLTPFSNTAIAFRAGYFSGPSIDQENVSGIFQSFSGGFGLQLKGMGLDYAFRPIGPFGFIHQTSLKIQWGGLR